MNEGYRSQTEGFGAWVRSLRRDYLGWTQQEVADAIGVSKVSVSHWERGGRAPVPMLYEALAALARTAGSPEPPEIDRRRGPRLGKE